MDRSKSVRIGDAEFISGSVPEITFKSIIDLSGVVRLAKAAKKGLQDMIMRQFISEWLLIYLVNAN
jgi:hypothetical protein